jgi:hypothetical protein
MWVVFVRSAGGGGGGGIVVVVVVVVVGWWVGEGAGSGVEIVSSERRSERA